MFGQRNNFVGLPGPSRIAISHGYSFVDQSLGTVLLLASVDGQKPMMKYRIIREPGRWKNYLFVQVLFGLLNTSHEGCPIHLCSLGVEPLALRSSVCVDNE